MKRRGIVLIVVLGTLFVMITLALIGLTLMTQESRIAEHKIRRVRAYYAAQAGMVDGIERLRSGIVPLDTLPTVGNADTYITCIGEDPANPGTVFPGYPTGFGGCPLGLPIRVVVLARGHNGYNDPEGVVHNCAATIPSDFCIDAKVIY